LNQIEPGPYFIILQPSLDLIQFISCKIIHISIFLSGMFKAEYIVYL